LELHKILDGEVSLGSIDDEEQEEEEKKKKRKGAGLRSVAALACLRKGWRIYRGGPCRMGRRWLSLLWASFRDVEVATNLTLV
jgi:hypothetical protein